MKNSYHPRVNLLIRNKQSKRGMTKFAPHTEVYHRSMVFQQRCFAYSHIKQLIDSKNINWTFLNRYALVTKISALLLHVGKQKQDIINQLNCVQLW